MSKPEISGHACDCPNEEPAKAETFYFYPRDKNGKRLGHTIAVIVKHGRPFVGFSQLAKGDQFVKKDGRERALGRARQQLLRFEVMKAMQFVREGLDKSFENRYIGQWPEVDGENKKEE